MTGLRQAVILVGGNATRLGDLAAHKPKPMLEVAGRPFIEHLFDQARDEGIKEIVLACANLKERFRDAYNGADWNGVSIECFMEDELSGTGGALSAMASRLDERFFVLNGDSLLRSRWSVLAQELDRPKVEAAMAVVDVKDSGRYGVVEIGDDCMVVGFSEKGSSGQGLVNAGVYAMHRKMVAQPEDGPLSLEHDVFPELVRRQSLAGVCFDGDFIDIGVPNDLRRADAFITGEKAIVS